MAISTRMFRSKPGPCPVIKLAARSVVSEQHSAFLLPVRGEKVSRCGTDEGQLKQNNNRLLITDYRLLTVMKFTEAPGGAPGLQVHRQPPTTDFQFPICDFRPPITDYRLLPPPSLACFEREIKATAFTDFAFHPHLAAMGLDDVRSEERRVGKSV